MSRGRLARVAADLARQQGLEAVTMRSVAAVSGVTPMAIYGYYNSSAEMRRAGVDFALRRVRNPPAEGSVEVRLRQWANAAWKVFHRHADLAAVCLTDWPELAEGCRIMEGLLAVAATHTQRTERQVHIAHAVFAHVLTGAIAESAVLGLRAQRSFPTVATGPRRFVRLVGLWSEFKRLDRERDFNTGLDALLDGLLK